MRWGGAALALPHTAHPLRGGSRHLHSDVFDVETPALIEQRQQLRDHAALFPHAYGLGHAAAQDEAASL